MTIGPFGHDGRQVAIHLHEQRVERTDWTLGYPRISPGQTQVVGGLQVLAAGAETGQDAGLRMRATARQLIAAAAATAGLAGFELRYQAFPQPGCDARVQILMLAKAYGNGPTPRAIVGSALAAAATCLPADFQVAVLPDIAEALWLPEWHAFLELQRTEQVTFPQWTFVPSDFYYCLDSISGDGSGWASFWAALARTPAPVTVSILIRPTEFDPLERDAIGSVLSQLNIYAHDRTDHNVLEHPEHYPADANALFAYEAWLDRVHVLGDRPVLAAPRSPATIRLSISMPRDWQPHCSRDQTPHPRSMSSGSDTYLRQRQRSSGRPPQRWSSGRSMRSACGGPPTHRRAYVGSSIYTESMKRAALRSCRSPTTRECRGCQ